MFYIYKSWFIWHYISTFWLFYFNHLMIIPLLFLLDLMTRLTYHSLIFIPGNIYFIVQCGIGADLWLVGWWKNRWCLENTKWGHFDKGIILSNVGSYWSEPEEALDIKIELIQASITKEIQGHVKVRQGRQKNYVGQCRQELGECQ